MGNSAPVIESIVDVGNDQGRKVRIHWSSNGRNDVGESQQPTGFAIYRRADHPAPTRSDSKLERKRGRGTSKAASTSEKTEGWDLLMTFSATGEEEYSVVVPTLVDSTESRGMAYSVFFVRAFTSTAGLHYDSPPDSGYSLNNLAPAAPANLKFVGNQLVWDEALETDFWRYTIYGGDSDDLDLAVLLAHSVKPRFDVSNHPHSVHLVTTSDLSGNESEAAAVHVQLDNGGLKSARNLLRIR